MRIINIQRKKKFPFALIKFYCVLNMSKEKFSRHVGLQEVFSLGYKSQFLNESTQIFPISNGESISIEINDEENTLFFVAFTSGGRIFSDEIIVATNHLSLSYSIKVKEKLTGRKILVDEV